MKRPIYFSLISLTILAYSGASSADAGNPIVRVGIYENPPKLFIAKSKEPSGIFIDILDYIASVEGWTLQYVPGTWMEGLARLERGEIDLMPDVAYTDERNRKYSFHKVPVLSSWFQIYAQRDSGIKSILDLNGKRIAILEKSVQQEALSRFSKGFGLNLKLLYVPDYQTMFELTAESKADAAVTNQFFGAMHAKNYGLQDTAVVFEPSSLFFAAPKGGNANLLTAIDRQLTSLKHDSSSAYYSAIKKWTSEEVRFQIPPWLKVFGFGAAIILVMSIGGSVVLRRQVATRTRELRVINQQMEQRILDRTAELAHAMEKAQAADRIKSSFLATMSHELRTPLNSIIGFTGILLQGLAGALNDEQNKQLSMVQNSSRHLLSLINDVLDISKIEAGQLELFFSSFDLAASIQKTCKLVQPLAQKAGIELSIEISSEVCSVVSDQRRLEQVLLNLLNNAVKFTDKGRVCLSCRRNDDKYCIAVSDTGIGMRQEELQLIFRPFHQIDSGLTRKREGTGLGLSICRKIMDMMGGVIEVESEWGKGSTFTIWIPVGRGEES